VQNLVSHPQGRTEIDGVTESKIKGKICGPRKMEQVAHFKYLRCGSIYEVDEDKDTTEKISRKDIQLSFFIIDLCFLGC
jgi:hypothetical protein